MRGPMTGSAGSGPLHVRSSQTQKNTGTREVRPLAPHKPVLPQDSQTPGAASGPQALRRAPPPTIHLLV